MGETENTSMQYMEETARKIKDAVGVLNSVGEGFSGKDKDAFVAMMKDALSATDFFKEEFVAAAERNRGLEEKLEELTEAFGKLSAEMAKTPLQKQCESIKNTIVENTKKISENCKEIQNRCVEGMSALKSGIEKAVETCKNTVKLTGIQIAKKFWEVDSKGAWAVLAPIAKCHENSAAFAQKNIDSLNSFKNAFKESKLGKGLSSLKNRLANAKEGFQGKTENIRNDRELHTRTLDGLISVFELSKKVDLDSAERCYEIKEAHEKNVSKYAGKEAELRATMNSLKEKQFDDMDKMAFSKENVIAASKGTIRFVPDNKPDISIEVSAKNITTSGDSLAANFDRSAKISVFDVRTGKQIDSVNFSELKEKYLAPKKQEKVQSANLSKDKAMGQVKKSVGKKM